MKRNFNMLTSGIFAIFLLSMVWGQNSLTAQTSIGGSPIGIINSGILEEPELLVLPPLDSERFRSEDNERALLGELFRYGVGREIDLGLWDAGHWTKLKTGDRVWQFEIQSPGALALGVVFSEFDLAPGATLFIYNGNRVIGAFSELNNPPQGYFATELLKGDHLIVELFEPMDQAGKSSLILQELVHAYRAVGFLGIRSAEYNSSASCEVDMNCPEGANWQNQKRGVARISVKSHDGSYGWCSGSLVNNAKQDCFPYFLSAYHCAGPGITDQDLASWVFYFNYERTGCNVSSEPEPVPNTLNGAYFRSQKDNGTSGSDFILLAIASYIPEQVNPFFNGWKNSNVASTNGFGIHHPSGDIKKISTYTQTLSNYYNTHWAVKWAATANGNGVTEGGSSGSPLFNPEGLVVGTLTGGLSACTVNGAGNGTGPNKEDVYGKVSYSWASGGTIPERRLKDWLDPENTGLTSLPGKNQDCTSFPPFADFSASSITVTAGSSITFSNRTITHPGSSTTYLWEFVNVEGSQTSIIKNPTKIFSIPGTYPVKLTATNVFGSTSKIIQVTVNPNGIEELDLGFEVFPVPANEILTISFSKNSGTESKIEIIDNTGRVIFEEPVINSSKELRVHHLPEGFYFIRWTQDNLVHLRKVSILH